MEHKSAAARAGKLPLLFHLNENLKWNQFTRQTTAAKHMSAHVSPPRVRLDGWKKSGDFHKLSAAREDGSISNLCSCCVIRCRLHFSPKFAFFFSLSARAVIDGRMTTRRAGLRSEATAVIIITACVIVFVCFVSGWERRGRKRWKRGSRE
jgi:hypothetical protein